MTKFPPIPRLSIVVPVGRDLATFEKTLISVLENQPEAAEILVCHDGHYDDPFELDGEVRFITGASNSVVDLVAAGALAANGRFVHVLAGGLQATEGWTDSAIEKFEIYDAGVVAPVIRSALDQQILAAGWSDTAGRLCKANASTQNQASAKSRKVIGAYLSASFWRREVIRSVTETCDLRNELDATYAYELMIRAAGWRCELAEQSSILSEEDSVPCDTPSMGRGKRLRAIRSCFYQGGWSVACKASALATLANLLNPSMLSESIGQSLAPTLESKIAKSLRTSDVVPCNVDEVRMIHQLPTVGMAAAVRRAA
ncbi:glycosyltransferase family protein [Rubripirellula reticaptiva]|uniref:glycosyltransferase family 2 protein n=1 Tax=Rubripirellula reticaptiva TaxID=2528013 RepID=UPI0011B720A6|nr:glycosyltransferase family 2 protein [Rubripirellula reticaptiva]